MCTCPPGLRRLQPPSFETGGSRQLIATKFLEKLKPSVLTTASNLSETFMGDEAVMRTARWLP